MEILTLNTNHECLVDLLDLTDLLGRLHLSNVINNTQMDSISSKSTSYEKNEKLLEILRGRTLRDYRQTSECLRQSKQSDIAKILDEGGGVMKVQVSSSKPEVADVYNLHQSIEDCRNRIAPWSYQSYQLITELREEGIEILNSQMDKQSVVIWMRCRSQKAVENLKSLYESRKLIMILSGFANIRSPGVETFTWMCSMVINIDTNQFKKTVAVRPMSIDLIERIGDKRVIGITKLRNEIYVVCLLEDDEYMAIHRHDRTRIRVYENRNPFRRFKRKIEEQEIIRIYDIGSSEKDNCVYVSDIDEKCIWKLTRETDDEYKNIKWLTIDYEPTTLSVSRNGHLLLNKPNYSTLMIYGSDAELIRSIQLSSEIRHPYHAAETSIGNIIIIHHMDGEKHGWPMGNRMGGFVLTELSSDGQTVVRRFVPSCVEQILGGPQYLVFDSHDQVFLADSENKRVILFDSDLNWNQIVCSTEAEEGRDGGSSSWPMRMCYDEENNHLIVGGYAIGGISVYSFSRK